MANGAAIDAAIHSQLAATYNQSRYSPEVGLALQRWADEMDRIGLGGGLRGPTAGSDGEPGRLAAS